MGDFIDTFMVYGAMLAMAVLIFSLGRAMWLGRKQPTKTPPAATQKTDESDRDPGA